MYLVVYAVAVGTLAILYLLYRILSGTWSLGKLVEGADGRASTSKLQWWLWTVVTIFSYMAIYAARAWHGDFAPVQDIPSNLLIAMGLSAATMAVAKGITVSYLTNGQIVKPPTTTPGAQATGPGAIAQDDDGVPDLSKIQLLAWTLIAAGTYLVTVVRAVGAPLPQLPDIAPALMVLMGLGQGGYLGKKLTTTTTPRLTGLSLGSGKPPLDLTLSGVAFGDAQGGNLITVDGRPLYVTAAAWKDALITFTLPAQRPDGTPWPPGQRVTIGLIVGGQDSANTLPFTIEA